ncbi:Gfo/Idh/MocA family oxidoreductase [Porphyromonadaceae bacterium]
MERIQPVVTGLASFGMSGSVFHAPFIDLHDGFVLHSIVERSSDKAKAIYPDVNTIRSYDELLSIPEIELVVVNTPDVTHYEFARKALLAGKHVVVEKPFVFTVTEGEELVALAEEKGLMCAVYQNRRWDSDFLTVKKIIESNRLGRIVEFHSAFQRFRKVIQTDTWKEKSDKRVGLTYNLGSHLIDQAIQLFGLPTAVFADIDILRDGSEVDDYFFIHLFYPQLKVTLRSGFLIMKETPRFYVHGTSGSFVKYGFDPQEALLKAGVKPNLVGWGMEESVDWGEIQTEADGIGVSKKIVSERGSYRAFYDEIYTALRSGGEPSTSAKNVLPVIRIIEAAFQSCEEKRVVDL